MGWVERTAAVQKRLILCIRKQFEATGEQGSSIPSRNTGILKNTDVFTQTFYGHKMVLFNQCVGEQDVVIIDPSPRSSSRKEKSTLSKKASSSKMQSIPRLRAKISIANT